MATLIQRDELDAAAVFPQCLDNQFVSFEHFAIISAKGLSYKHPEITAPCQARTVMEINRSLVYGQQVCVNRASLPNCKSLYEFYLPYFDSDDGGKRENPRYRIDAMGELLKQRAVVPYLFQGTTIEGDGEYSLDNEGQRALHHLFEKHADKISFLSLGVTLERVRENASRIALEFENRADRLAQVAESSDLYPIMLAEVLPCAELIEHSEAVDGLRYKIYQLSELASKRAATRRRSAGTSYGTLTREDVYKELFVQNCTCGKGFASKECICVPDGRFAAYGSESERRTQFCLKALVDLVYASNVPDLLGRYVMTPWQLRTRNALQEHGAVELEHAATIDDVARETFTHSQRLHARFSEAMFLPMLGELTLDDICEIRKLKEWRTFMDTQERLLLNPLQGARTFDEFQDSFVLLQRGIANYWTNKRFEGEAGKKYQSFVSAVFQIGKYGVQLGVRHIPHIEATQVFILDKVIDYVAKQLDRVTVGPAKLLFEVFDSETRAVDASRSWSVEWMRKQVAWSKQELLDLLRDEKAKAADELRSTSAVTADVAGG